MKTVIILAKNMKMKKWWKLSQFNERFEDFRKKIKNSNIISGTENKSNFDNELIEISQNRKPKR